MYASAQMRARFPHVHAFPSLISMFLAAACSSSTTATSRDAGHDGEASHGSSSASKSDGGKSSSHDSQSASSSSSSHTSGTSETTGSTTRASSSKDAGASDTGIPDAGPPAYPFDILTQRGNNARSAVYASEQSLTRANVAGIQPVFSVVVDGQIYAQPLYVSEYPVGGTTRNILIVATEHNTVFAFDADTGAAVWPARHLGTPMLSSLVGSGYTDISPEVGVTATPVIDRENGILYVTNKDVTGTDAAPVVTHRLHILSLATGEEVTGSPFTIRPEVPGTADDAGGLLAFDPVYALQRPALLLLNGLVYLAFGSHGDQGIYHGMLVAYQYDATSHTLTQKLAWSASPDSNQSAIWMGGQGPIVDSEGYIYVTVANGNSQHSIAAGGLTYAEAIVKLKSSDLTVADYFLPEEYETMNGADEDMSGGGPQFIPGTSYVVAAGKSGTMFVVDTKSMGHEKAFNSQIPQFFDVGFEFFGSPLAWHGEGSTWLYIWPVGGGTSTPPAFPALSIAGYPLQDGGTFNAMHPLSQPNNPTTATGTFYGVDPVGILALSSNGDTAGTGILWANKPNGNPNRHPVPGTLYAFDPTTLNMLWNSSTTLGNYSKFVPPIVANGKVYLPGTTTADGGAFVQHVLAYGLKN